MKAQETLTRLFPNGNINYCMLEHVGTFQVGKLPLGAEPVNCDVVLRGKSRNPVSTIDRREYFLVKAEGATLFFRIDTRMENGINYEVATGQSFEHPVPAGALERHARLVMKDTDLSVH